LRCHDFHKEDASVLSPMDIAAILLTLCAAFGWINHKFLPLSRAVGLLVMSVTTSAIVLVIEAVYPQGHFFAPLTDALRKLDFTAVVVNGMLSYLLFAGALDVDLARLKDRAIPVLALAVTGTVLSTALVGLGFWGLAKLADQPLSLPCALVFGALISPTDPVAVISTLRRYGIPPDLEIVTQGEALFNDGIGIVLFIVLLRFAVSGNQADVAPLAIGKLVLIEACGGIALGLASGYVAYLGMRLIDDYGIEVLISIALVNATYAVARHLHTSGPLSVVAAGLLIGDRGPRFAMSERTKRYLFALWILIDEVLNSVLFLLVGLEALFIRFNTATLALASATVPLVILSRLAAVSMQPVLFGWSGLLSWRNAPFLTWAGVHGGISVALALSRRAGKAARVDDDVYRCPIQHRRSRLDPGLRSATYRRNAVIGGL
jgi:monovalent cation:H+ antiporter, CPA1 family